jgi:hypothetical protein
VISTLNAPSDRTPDVYPFNIEHRTLEHPLPDEATLYDVPSPAALHPLTDLRALQQEMVRMQAKIMRQDAEITQLKTDTGMISIAMLELISRLEALEYRP